MKRSQTTIILAVAALLFLFAVGAVVLAQTSAGFDLSWHTLSNGGGESSSASYEVNGTIGQSLSSPTTSGSASFTVSSGYWAGGGEITVYLPLIIKN